jgi:hypothetical protein
LEQARRRSEKLEDPNIQEWVFAATPLLAAGQLAASANQDDIEEPVMPRVARHDLKTGSVGHTVRYTGPSFAQFYSLEKFQQTSHYDREPE